MADKLRPKYHFSISGNGNPGDSNGAFWDGHRYHLMYLVKRDDGYRWGHVSSMDMVDWEGHPDAIGPGEAEPGGCFSGGGFIDGDDTAYLTYWMLWGPRGLGIAKSHAPFDQWEKLVALLKGVAASSATERTQYAINRVVPKDGRAQLVDRASNNLAVEGGTTTVVMPDMVPGKVRDFMLRVTATGENDLVFTGAEAFEGEEGSLEPPGDGETVVYFFTETSADVLLVARKAVERIET